MVSVSIRSKYGLKVEGNPELLKGVLLLLQIGFGQPIETVFCPKAFQKLVHAEAQGVIGFSNTNRPGLLLKRFQECFRSSPDAAANV